MGVSDGRLRDLRRQMTDDGEPLLKRSVKVVGGGNDSNTPYVTPTQDGAEIAGIEIGDTQTIEIYEDGVFIPTDE